MIEKWTNRHIPFVIVHSAGIVKNKLINDLEKELGVSLPHGVKMSLLTLNHKELGYELSKLLRNREKNDK